MTTLPRWAFWCAWCAGRAAAGRTWRGAAGTAVTLADGWWWWQIARCFSWTHSHWHEFFLTDWVISGSSKNSVFGLFTWARCRSFPDRSGCARSRCTPGSCVGRGSEWCRRCLRKLVSQRYGPPGLLKTYKDTNPFFDAMNRQADWQRNLWMFRCWSHTRKQHIRTDLFPSYRSLGFIPLISRHPLSSSSHLSLTSRTRRMLEKRVFLSLMMMVSSRSRLSMKCSVRTRSERR